MRAAKEGTDFAGQLTTRIGFGHGPVVGDFGQYGNALTDAILTDLIVADVATVEHDGQRQF